MKYNASLRGISQHTTRIIVVPLLLYSFIQQWQNHPPVFPSNSHVLGAKSLSPYLSYLMATAESLYYCNAWAQQTFVGEIAHIPAKDFSE
jgi:hypothetical protein